MIQVQLISSTQVLNRLNEFQALRLVALRLLSASPQENEQRIRDNKFYWTKNLFSSIKLLLYVPQISNLFERLL